jgi:hypothetical protein
MSQDTQPYELTVAELLRAHRDWIRMLFVDQGKTEVEIIELLYQRKLFVS